MKLKDFEKISPEDATSIGPGHRPPAIDYNLNDINILTAVDTLALAIGHIKQVIGFLKCGRLGEAR